MRAAIKSLNPKNKPLEGECFAWLPVKAWYENDRLKYRWIWLERVKYKYMSKQRLLYDFYILDHRT